MKLCTVAFLATLAGILPVCAGAVEVYKWTDEQGNVIYSDKPHRGAVKIEVPTAPAGIVPVPPEKIPAQDKGAEAGPYGALIVVSPSSGQMIAESDGAVDVSLALEPALRTNKGDAIRLRLDGQVLEQRYGDVEIGLEAVARGSHTLQAEVVDAAGAVLIASAPVTFNVQAPSALAPAGPDIYQPTTPPPAYPPTYKPVYPPQPYPPQGRPKPR